MTKGIYVVNEENPSRNDTSFRSCLCTLLVFLSICILFLLVGVYWTGKKVTEKIDEVKADIDRDRYRQHGPPYPVGTRGPIPYTRRDSGETTTEPSTLVEVLKTSTTSILTTQELPSNKSEQVEDITETTLTEETFTENVTAVEGEATKSTFSDLPGETTTTEEYSFLNSTTELLPDLGGTEDVSRPPRDVNDTQDSSTYPEELSSTTPTNSGISSRDQEVKELSSTIPINSGISSRDYEVKELSSTTPANSGISSRDQEVPSRYQEVSSRYQEVSSAIPLTRTEGNITKINAESQNGSPTTVSTQKTTTVSAAACEVTVPPPPEPVCLSPGCKSAASRILSLMDHSADACEDFYQFACGGMQAGKEGGGGDDAESATWETILAQMRRIEANSPLHLRKFAAFYNGCVEYEYIFKFEERIRKLNELVKEVGLIYDGSGKAPSIDTTDLFAKLILRSSLPFMDVDVDIDKQDSNFILQLTLPGRSSAFGGTGHWSAISGGRRRCLHKLRDVLNGRNLVLEKIHDVYLNCLKNHSVYLNSIENVVRALGVFSHLPIYNQTQRIQELRTIIEWDVLDHMNSISTSVRHDIVYKKYKVMKLADLQVHFPFLEWKRFFKTLIGKELTDGTRVHVYFFEHFRDLFKGLMTSNKWKLSNSLIAMYAHELYESLVVSVERDRRERYCLKLSSELLPDVGSSLYAQSWSTKQKDATEKFFAKVFFELKHNFSRSLQKVDWLDDGTRTAALLKVQNLKLVFNKDDDNFNNETLMTEKYKDVDVAPENYPKNYVEFGILRKKSVLALIGQPFSSNVIWGNFINSYDTAPYTVYSKMLSVFPQGVLRKYNVNLPSYVTMGQVGLTIAREIGHHFDPVGKDYDWNLQGSQSSAYSNMETTMKNILLGEKTRELGKQTIVFKVDPSLSLKERIADNTGLRLISDYFKTFDNLELLPWIKKDISRQKLFFLAVAQEYCTPMDAYKYMIEAYETELLPAPLRLENVVSNSENFVTTFGCREGSKMNDVPTKTQFPYLEKSEDEYEGNYEG